MVKVYWFASTCMVDFQLNKLTSTVLTRHYIRPLRLYAPPYYLHEFGAEVYLSIQFTPPSASATPTNERKVRTHRTTLYMKSSYLLASDTPTKRLATQRQARILLVVVRKLHRVFWPLTLCVFIENFMILCKQNWATTSFIASCTRRWRIILPLLFPSRAPPRGKGAYKRD